MKFARRQRHFSFSIFHYPFSIDSNKFQFIEGTEQLPGIKLPIKCVLPRRASCLFLIYMLKYQ